MADLQALIRIRKFDVEERQKFLAELYARQDRLTQKKEQLLQQLAEEEANLDAGSVEMMTYFGRFKAMVDDQLDDLAEEMTRLDAQVEVARDAVREAFAELKKVEITEESRVDAAKAAQDKKEGDALDEMALQIFRDKQDDA